MAVPRSTVALRVGVLVLVMAVVTGVLIVGWMAARNVEVDRATAAQSIPVPGLSETVTPTPELTPPEPTEFFSSRRPG